MSDTNRIDSRATDFVVLMTISHLQSLNGTTSNKDICDHCPPLKTHSVKRSLKRLKQAGIVEQITGGQGINPVYEIRLSGFNEYFSDVMPSPSTQYRNLNLLADMSLLRYDNASGNYLLKPEELLKAIEKQKFDVDEFLASVTGMAATQLNKPIPQITQAQFIQILEGQSFTFDGPLFHLNTGDE